jgi:hypothetical protein
MPLVTHCARCGLYASPDDSYCGDCGALLLDNELSEAKAGTTRGGSVDAPARADARAFVRSNAGLLATTALLSAVAVAIIKGGLATTQFLPDGQAIVVSALLAAAGAVSVVAFGVRRFMHALLYLSIYLSGGFVFLSIMRSTESEMTSFADWRSWIIYSGLFSFAIIVLPRLRMWLRDGRALTPRMSSLLEDARELQIVEEAHLRRLPSHQWYLIATWVTGATMVGSSITTAIGLHSEITDPYDHWVIQYAIPVGLACLASLIIWAGWNFVYLKLRIADSMLRRIAMFVTGLAILTPLTLAIHTVFGVIGVGGTEGLRAHHLWYADVLNAAHDRVDAERESEAGLIQTLGYVGENFKTYMTNEVAPGGTGCGAGQGQLYQFYRDRGNESASLLKAINERKSTGKDLPERLIALRERIVDPGKRFTDAQLELGREFKVLRSDILALQGGSIRGTVKTFLGNLNLVEGQEFFRTWDACQLQKRDEIVQRVRNFRTSIESEMQAAQAYIKNSVAKSRQRERGERRIESIPFIDRFLGYFEDRQTAVNAIQAALPDPAAPPSSAADQQEIPTFIPLRPFWAVVSYASKLPGYVALQLALDFSPAVFGLLFALLAPLPFQVMRDPRERVEAAGASQSDSPPRAASGVTEDVDPDADVGAAGTTRSDT